MRKIKPTIDPLRVKNEVKAGYLKAYVAKDGSIMLTSTITGDCMKIGEATNGKKEHNNRQCTESKRILDPCCGSRMFWFNKENQDVMFCDIRSFETTLCDGRTIIVHPDMIADFTRLPFEDNTFYHVVFDPPHMRSLGENSWMAKKYGLLKDDWKEVIHDGFSECMRVLKPNGTLIFKWSEYDIKVSEILKVIDYKPLYGHKSGKQQLTHWMAFIK